MMIIAICALVALAAAADTGCEGKTTIAGEFKPSAEAGTDDMNVKYSIDCAAKTVTFTVSSSQADGWLALGWNTELDAMAGMEAVQMRLKGDGTGEARSIYVKAGLTEENLDVTESATQALTAVSGSKANGVITVSFTKAWDGKQNGSIALASGTALGWNVAKNNVTSDWSKKHTNEGPSEEKIDVFNMHADHTSGPAATTAATTAAAGACKGLACDACVKNSACSWCDSGRALAEKLISNSTGSTTGSCTQGDCSLGAKVKFTTCTSSSAATTISLIVVGLVSLALL